MTKEVGIFYLYIHSKLVEISTNRMIKVKEAVSYLHEWRIPKTLRIAIIKELEKLGLAIKIDRNTLLLEKQQLDPEDTYHVYKLVGINH